jgi:hypothetical protein
VTLSLFALPQPPDVLLLPLLPLLLLPLLLLLLLLLRLRCVACCSLPAGAWAGGCAALPAAACGADAPGRANTQQQVGVMLHAVPGLQRG